MSPDAILEGQCHPAAILLGTLSRFVFENGIEATEGHCPGVHHLGLVSHRLNLSWPSKIVRPGGIEPGTFPFVSEDYHPFFF